MVVIRAIHGLQLADMLTKLSDKLIERFTTWLRHPWIQLREAAGHPNRHSSQQSTRSMSLQEPGATRMA